MLKFARFFPLFQSTESGGGGAADATLAQGGSSSAPPTETPAPAPAAAPEATLRDVIDQAAQELGTDKPPTATPAPPTPPGAAAPAQQPQQPADPFAEPQPAQQPAAPLTPQQVYERLGIDASKIPPQLQEQGANFLRELYSKHYEPAAAKVAQYAHTIQTRDQEQVAWYQQAQQWQQSQEFQIATALANDPALLQRVQQFLSGAQQGADLPPIGNIDPSLLDDQSRAIYAIAQRAYADNQALRSALGELRAHVAQQGQSVESRFGAMAEAERSQRRASIETGTQQELAGAVQAFNKSLGFDITQRPEFKQAINFALREVDAEAAAARREGRAPNLNVRGILRDALIRAGFRDIHQRRQQQAATSPRSPSNRAGGSMQAGNDLRAFIDEAATELAAR